MQIINIYKQINTNQENSVNASLVNDTESENSEVIKALNSFIEILQFRPKVYLDEFYQEAFEAYFISNNSNQDEFEQNTNRLYQEVIQNIVIDTEQQFINHSESNLFSEYLEQVENQMKQINQNLESELVQISLEPNRFFDPDPEKYLNRLYDNIDDFFLYFNRINLGLIDQKKKMYASVEKVINNVLQRDNLAKLVEKDKQYPLFRKLFEEFITEHNFEKIAQNQFSFSKSICDDSLSNDKIFFYKQLKRIQLKILNKIQKKNMILISIGESVDDPNIELPSSTLFDLFNRIKKKATKLVSKLHTENRSNQDLFKEEFIHKASFFLFETYIRKINDEKQIILTKIRNSMIKVYKFPFQKDFVDFDGYTVHQILNIIFYYTTFHICNNDKILSLFQEKYNLLKETKINKKISRMIDPSFYIRTKEIEFLETSKTLAKENKNSFIVDLIKFIDNVHSSMINDVKQNISQNITKKELYPGLKEIIQKVDSPYSIRTNQDDTYFDHRFFPNDIYKMTDTFCGEMRGDEFYEEQGIQLGLDESQSQLKDPDFGGFEGYKEDYFEIIFSSLNNFFHKFEDSYFTENMAIYQEVCESNPIETNKKYEDLVYKCTHTCDDCFGICLLSSGHQGDHLIYHIPRIYHNQDPLLCLDRDDINLGENIHSYNSDDHASDIRSSLFWSWMLLRYNSEISKCLGLSRPLIDMVRLTSREIKILNMSEDEVIDQI